MKRKFQCLRGLAASMLVSPASADVIYSNLQDIAIPATYDGVYLNVETGSWNTDALSPAAGWDINPYIGGSILWNSPSFQPVRSGTGNMDSVLNLGSGAVVSGSSVFSTFVQGPSGANPGAPGYGGSDTHLGVNPGQFNVGSEGYLGFRLNGTNYGWMRVVLTNNTGGALIRDWAYDNSGLAIATGNVLQDGSTVTLDSAFGDFTLGSAITGSNSASKVGAGTTTLAAANTYSGTTTVNAGTLLVNGSHLTATADSGYTVGNAGSTLGGTGRLAVNGNISVAPGAFIAPGASIGTLTLDGVNTTGAVLGMAAGSRFAFELGGSGGTPDQLAFWNYLSDDLGLNDNAIDLSLLGTQSEGTYNVDIFRFFSDGGAVAATHAFASGLTIGTLGTGISSASIDWDGTGNNNQTIALTYTVIPEPSAALLGGLGLLALLRRRRIDCAHGLRSQGASPKTNR